MQSPKVLLRCILVGKRFKTFCVECCYIFFLQSFFSACPPTQHYGIFFCNCFSLHCNSIKTKKMKHFTLSIAVVLLLSLNSFTPPTTNPISEIIQTNFNEGFADGYCEGWKDVKGELSLCPLTPLPPLPKIGQSSNSYRDGYNTGFKRGMKDANKD